MVCKQKKGRIIVAIPKSASTSLGKYLAKKHGLIYSQDESKREKIITKREINKIEEKGILWKVHIYLYKKMLQF